MPFHICIPEDFSSAATRWSDDLGHHADTIVFCGCCSFYWEHPHLLIDVRWEIHARTRGAFGYFTFDGNRWPPLPRMVRPQLRRRRKMRTNAIDTPDEFSRAIGKKGLSPDQMSIVCQLYDRLLTCLNPVPERAEIHDIVDYDS